MGNCIEPGCIKQSTCGDYCGSHCNCNKKKQKPTRPLTELELLICNSLLKVSVLAGSPKKKFINTLNARIKQNLVSENQVNYILHLFYHFRRQIKDYNIILNSLPQSK